MTKLNIEGHDQWKMDEESGSIELVSKSEYEKYMCLFIFTHLSDVYRSFEHVNL